MKNLLPSRSSRALLSLVFAVTLISSLFVAASFTAAAAPAVSQCNGTDNVGGQAVECHYTVVNTMNGATTSSSVTLTACHGAANAPPTMVCTSSTVTSTDLVTSVDQCNGSGNGGGGTVECTVDVINNITGTVTPTAATVNQCNVSGTGGGTAPTVLCNPFPANTTSATVTQCNESGNGGGGTQRVRCTVGSGSTTTALLTVTVNQCNGSGNGGGATVVCHTSLTNNVTAPAPAPTASPTTPVPTPTASPTTPGPTPTVSPTAPVVPAPTSSPTTPVPPTPPAPVAPVSPVGPGGNPISGPAPDQTETPELDQNEAGPTGGGDVVSGAPGAEIETGQVTQIPVGGAAAGGGSTSGFEKAPLVPLGMLMIALGAGVLVRRRFGFGL